MLQAIEAIVDPNGAVQLLEPLRIAQPMRAVVTLLEPVEKQGNNQAMLALLHSPLFTDAAIGDPIAIEEMIQRNRDNWDDLLK
ncbi:MAG: hypothetical protein RIT27_27 [Pseudomonadota bacterium]|jgi:hypothetical protein